jgi:hypothetical protein
MLTGEALHTFREVSGLAIPQRVTAAETGPANTDWPILALRPDAEDEGHDVGWCREVRLPRAGLEVLQALESVLSIAAEPSVELASRDSEESARPADVVRDLLEVLRTCAWERLLATISRSALAVSPGRNPSEPRFVQALVTEAIAWRDEVQRAAVRIGPQIRRPTDLRILRGGRCPRADR